MSSWLHCVCRMGPSVTATVRSGGVLLAPLCVQNGAFSDCHCALRRCLASLPALVVPGVPCHALCVRVEVVFVQSVDILPTWQMPREAVHGRIQGGAKEGRSTCSCPSKILCVLGMAQCDRLSIRTGRTGMIIIIFPSLFYSGIQS